MSLDFKIVSDYQRIIKDGKEIQKGCIDTIKKFDEITRGVDLKNKTLIDIGCNCGMMAKLATERGAIATGIDLIPERIWTARKLFPEIKFLVQSAFQIDSHYDMGIAVGFLHYIKDWIKLFKKLSRRIDYLMVDVWIEPGDDAVFYVKEENQMVPTRKMFLNIVGQFYKTIKDYGETISPSVSSKRVCFHLSDPIRPVPECVLVFGRSRTGKTGYARALVEQGYIRAELDYVFYGFRFQNLRDFWDVASFASILRGNFIDKYLEFYKNWLVDFLNKNRYENLVIDGYELNFLDLRNIFIQKIQNAGWKVVLKEFVD